MKYVAMLLILAVIVVGILYGVGFFGSGADTLCLRVAVDISHSEPILEQFKKDTGINVEIMYDEEASKTVVHVMKIMEEQKSGNPHCDVFWNNEIVHTLRLKQLGYTEAYQSPSAADIPAEFKDAEHHWAGFGARARIFIVNTDLLPDEADRPTTYADLANPKFAGKGTFARPETGTTLTHVAALFNDELLGLEGAKKFLEGCVENRVNWAPSNGQTMARVRDGSKAFGFTDTDDYNLALKRNAPVAAVYPDQGEGQLGTMVLPNTVCLLKDSSHPEQAKKLIDYILSKEVEEALANGLSRQIPVRAEGVKAPEGMKIPGRDFRAMKIDWEKVAAEFDDRKDEARKILRKAE